VLRFLGTLFKEGYMNKNEYEMLEVLKWLKNEYGVYEIKAEF